MTRTIKPKNKRAALLITGYRAQIINAVKNNRVIIITGQTGCGKSTQVPQYLHESRNKLELKNQSIIACLHPRSIAAMSLAERVAHETNTTLGDIVGYRVRFYSKCERTARIVYMTAGFMMRLLNDESVIMKYGIVIIDEAHERSIQNDIVMGQMKNIMAKNKNVKLVIMSATLNVEEIEAYYQGATVIRISPMADHVDVIYRRPQSSDYVLEAVKIVQEILRQPDKGHVLIFLPSEEKVTRCKQLLKQDKHVFGPVLLKFYSAMDKEDKLEVFRDYNGRRKIIVATNIAETSLTIEGVTFVIDCGFVKRVKYNHQTGVDHWITERISVAEADQRKGRAGRTGSSRGTCYRLYDRFDYAKELQMAFGQYFELLSRRYNLATLRAIAENASIIAYVSDSATVSVTSGQPTNGINTVDFADIITKVEQMLSTNLIPKTWVARRYPVPEIENMNLDYVVITMKAMKIDIDTFKFIVPPNTDDVTRAICRLKQLSLLDDNGNLTSYGQEAAKLPLSPTMAKVAVFGSKTPCRDEVFIIIAMLSVAFVVKKPSQKKRASSHSYFDSQDGDLFKLLNIYQEAERMHFSYFWCKSNRIFFSSLKYARLIMMQLRQLLPSQWGKESPRSHFDMQYRLNMTKIAFLSGFFQHLSVCNNRVYNLIDGKRGNIFQFSCVKRYEK